MTIYFARISNMTCRVAEKQLIHLANRSVDNIYNCWQNLTGFQNQSASFMIKESVGTRERRGSSILPWKTTEEDDGEEANAKLSYSETLTPTSQWSLSHVASRKQSCFYMTSGNFSFFPPHCICKPVAQFHTAQRALSLSLPLRAIAWPGKSESFPTCHGNLRAAASKQNYRRRFGRYFTVFQPSHAAAKTQQTYTYTIILRLFAGPALRTHRALCGSCF